MAKPPSDSFSRRAFMQGSGAVAAASTAEDFAEDMMPKAFVKQDAQQCGGTPGFVIAVRAFLPLTWNHRLTANLLVLSQWP